MVSAKEELCRLEEEHMHLEERERREGERVAQLTARVEELEADCDGYKDQLKNLEVRREGRRGGGEVRYGGREGSVDGLGERGGGKTWYGRKEEGKYGWVR